MRKVTVWRMRERCAQTVPTFRITYVVFWSTVYVDEGRKGVGWVWRRGTNQVSSFNIFFKESKMRKNNKTNYTTPGSTIFFFFKKSLRCHPCFSMQINNLRANVKCFLKILLRVMCVCRGGNFSGCPLRLPYE
jgi:hypothetical protein